MSAEGPESVPTSADPRSHRPTKKRALTPLSAQAATVEALFAKPDQEIRLPPSLSSSSTALAHNRSAPPELVTNVQGSSSGAGSGEFHVYKASRRREYERLREMDEQVRREKDAVTFDSEKSEKERKDLERTRKNREKREKMKARKSKKGKAGDVTSGDNPTVAGLQPNAASRDGKDENKVGGEPQQNESSDRPAGTSEPVGLVIHDDD